MVCHGGFAVPWTVQDGLRRRWSGRPSRARGCEVVGSGTARAYQRSAGKCPPLPGASGQPCRFSNRHLPATVYETWNSKPINVLTHASVHRCSAKVATHDLGLVVHPRSVIAGHGFSICAAPT